MCPTYVQEKALMASQTASFNLDYVIQGQKSCQPRQNQKTQNPAQFQDKFSSCELTHNGPDCPAKGKKCLNRGELNNFWSDCQSARNEAANELQVCSAKACDHDDTPLYLGDVHI